MNKHAAASEPGTSNSALGCSDEHDPLQLTEAERLEEIDPMVNEPLESQSLDNFDQDGCWNELEAAAEKNTALMTGFSWPEEDQPFQYHPAVESLSRTTLTADFPHQQVEGVPHLQDPLEQYTQSLPVSSPGIPRFELNDEYDLFSMAV